MHYHINEFCRVCFASNGNLSDVTKASDRSNDGLLAESPIDKLTCCVSEVDWSSIEKVLMCQNCISRLNSAYEFKQQCLESNLLFKKFLGQLNCSSKMRKKKIAVKVGHSEVKQEYVDSYSQILQEDLLEGGNALSLRIKAAHELNQELLLSNSAANNKTSPGVASAIQGFVLNVLPANSLVLNTGNNPGTATLLQGNGIIPTAFLPILSAAKQQQTKLDEKNQTNELLQQKQQTNKEVNIVQFLSESATEELSVDIDPSIYDLSQDGSTPTSTDATGADWDEVITCNTISTPKTGSGTQSVEKSSPGGSFVPILPKPNSLPEGAFQDANFLNFFSVDHFMAADDSSTFGASKVTDDIYRCDKCPAIFTTLAYFRNHQQSHLKPLLSGVTKTESALVASLTATSKVDFSPNSVKKERGGMPASEATYQCDKCPSFFDSPLTFARHKSTLHNEKQPKKKYFVKGMKNARCDICHRDFSTQSYLQQHKKLHFRNSDYRLKVKNLQQLAEQNQPGSVSPKPDISITPIPPITPTSTETIGDDDQTTKESIETMMETTMTELSTEEPSESTTEPVKESNGSFKIKINLKDLPQSKSGQEDDGGSTNEAPISDMDETVSYINGGESEEDGRGGGGSDAESSDNSMDCDNSEDILAENVFEGDLDPCNKEDESLEERRPYEMTTVEGKPQCSVCLKMFSRRHDLKRHMNNIHLKTIQYMCHLCNSQFYEAFHLTRHLRIHVGFVRCTKCTKDFSTVRDLKFHIVGAHESGAPGQCGICGETFKRIKRLREHMQEHEKSIMYKCHICGDEFRESRELTRHLVGHSGMYSCGDCQTTFPNEYELNNHIKCHLDGSINEKKYECSVCHNRYKKKRYLNTHFRNMHTTP